MNLKERAKGLKNDIPAIYIALKKKDTPGFAKVMACITIGYALSPIDLIPDFIPVLGYLDDLILLPFFVAITIYLIPDDIMKICRKESEELWASGKPKRWFLAIPIILVWVLIMLLIIKIVYPA